MPGPPPAQRSRWILAVLAVLAGLAGLTLSFAGTAGAVTGPVLRSVTAIAYPSGAPKDSTLTDVSCTGPEECLAVGSWAGGAGGSPAPLAMADRGSGFTPVPLWSAGAASPMIPAGVTCPAAGSPCVVVGDTDPDHGSGAQAAVQGSPSGWTVTDLPAVTPGDAVSVDGVSCPLPTACVVVGQETPSAGSPFPVVESGDGTTWSAQALANPPGTSSGLGAVSCPAAGSCTAVGTSSTFQFFAATLTGGTWTTTAIPGGGGLLGAGLLSLSCPAAGRCVAAGFTDGSDAYPSGQPVVVVQHGGTWSDSVLPGVSDAGGLTGVSCPAVDFCMATGGTGGYLTSSSQGSWTMTTVPNPVGPGRVGAVQMEGISCLAPLECQAVGSALSGTTGTTDSLAVRAGAPTQGYLGAAADGGVFTQGTARFFGSAAGRPLNAPVVGMAETPDGAGYWLAAADGGVFSFGDAAYLGSMGGRPLNRPIVGMAATPDGRGYWLVAADGGLFSFGDAAYLGSMGGRPLNRPIVGMAATPDGRGYWLVAADGGLFSFGDAAYLGSLGGLALQAPVAGLAPTPDGRGYWMVGQDGGVFTFGDATFFGSTGGSPGGPAAVGLSPTPSGQGYWLARADGGVVPFGDAQNWGPLAPGPLAAPLVGLATQAG